MNGMSPESDFAEVFLQKLAEINRVIGFICRRNGLRHAEAEDFASQVRLKLIENDYAILRKFQNRCSFSNYLLVVVQRLLLDERNHLRGKWHASMEAKRIGDLAITVEKLLHQDRKSVEEVHQIVTRTGHLVTKADLENLIARLPRRRPRPQAVDLDEANLSVSPDSIEANAFGRDRSRVAGRLSRIVRDAIAKLPTEDRALIRMRFGAEMTIAQIARAMRIQQKPIYRRLERRLMELREVLNDAGVGASEARDVLDAALVELDFGFEAESEILLAETDPPTSGATGGETT